MNSTAMRAIDESAIARLRRFGGAKLISAMVTAFLKDAPMRLATARHHADAGDAAGVRRELHSLRSSAGQLGALAMQELCAAGEELAANGFTPTLIETVRNVTREFDVVEEELAALRDAPIA
ncbi:MAG TPA: Hpt domain-containing protein [Gemmatimonadaceae bacterium]|nr:Hpt domain-containing protein [Gemmatimonadaceae bacterium]